MTELFKSVIDELKLNKQIRESGKYIGIPMPFPRMRKIFPYITRGRYVIVTANSKVGKSQIGDFLFMFWVFLLKKELNISFKFKIFYFSLEMSRKDKIKAAISFFLYYYKGIEANPDKISSQYDDYILDDKLLKEIEDIQPIIEEFLSMIEFIDEIKNPYGIFKYCKDYAENNGHYTYKKIDWNNEDGTVIKKEVKDLYIPNDPDEFRIIIVDNYNLIATEDGDNDQREAIGRFSSKHCIELRNKLDYLIVGIQQQAQAQEGVENAKMNMLRPSQAGLGENKTTGRDVDLLFGLFAPNRYGIKTHEGYDISKLRDNYREFITIHNRRGASISTDLYFNGAVNYFKELPKSEDMTPDIYDSISNGKINIKLV